MKALSMHANKYNISYASLYYVRHKALWHEVRLLRAGWCDIFRAETAIIKVYEWLQLIIDENYGCIQ